MTTLVAADSPLAAALANVIQPKLVEMTWASDGGDDSALIEYIILMLVNGKTQQEIAHELSNDLLGLDSGDTQALAFSGWLFEQVELLNQQINGAPASSDPSSQAISNQGTEAVQQAPQADLQDADTNMDDSGPGNNSIPTGPKAMRTGRQNGRGRMLNQINQAMDRNDPLHRTRGQGGVGKMQNSRGNFRTRPYQNGGGRNFGGRGGMNMGMGPNPMMNNMSPQDQMHMMSLLEEQARMMAEFMPGLMPPAINPAFQPNAPQHGRSLFDRVERHSGNRPQGSFNRRNDDDAMDMGGGQDETNTNNVCRFNLRCTKKDCPFAHQSPAAPEGTQIDMEDECSFGAACKNRKCTGRHPSPAVKSAHQAEEMCKFFPNCTNPHCTFKHPSMPLCRNGADCTTEGCKFTHVQTACKYHPCLNRACPYKHEEGQRGSFGDKVWTADGQGQHVSERKFVSTEEGEEELIKPDEAAQNTEVAT